MKEDCWLWQGAKKQGYGMKKINGKTWSVHRYYYQKMNGPIPPGLTIDHLCRNRSCYNPAHLEAVTQRENVKRMFASKNDKLRENYEQWQRENPKRS